MYKIILHKRFETHYVHKVGHLKCNKLISSKLLKVSATLASFLLKIILRKTYSSSDTRINNFEEIS